MRVLHVEAGAAYGGSLRALEIYLAHSERSRFVHDLLLYYSMPEAERLRPLVRELRSLYGAAPAKSLSRSKVRRRLRAELKGSVLGPALMEMREWIGLGRSIPLAFRLSRLLREGDYDLVHVNNTFTYQAPTLLAAQMAGVPVVAHVRGLVGPAGFGRRLMRWTNCVVTVSRVLEKELKRWGLPVAVQTCYAGAELQTPDERAASDLRASLVPPGGILIGSVGRLGREKGYHYLVHAARRVVDARPEVRFAVAGEGPLRPALQGLIRELKLDDHFQLCGFRADIASFLAAMDLFVCSSLQEGMPLAVVEAMLLGKPVIATDVGGNSEIVVPGRTGTLVAPGDPDALANALLAALDQKDLLALLASEGRQIAAAVTDSRSNAQALDRVFEGVLTSSDSRTRGFYEQVYSTEAWRRPEGGSDSIGSRFTKMWCRALLDYVAPRLNLQGKRVLEVGCGNGYLVPHLCASGAGYVGVDIALNAIRDFPQLDGAKYCAAVADGRFLPFTDGTFDLVICLEVLEHVAKPGPLLDECFRVVRPGGRLVFSCPNYCNLFILPRILADLGLPYFRRYMRRQVVDRLTSAFGLRRLLARRGTICLQRGVRLHPPFSEQLDYRLPLTNPLRRLNDWIFEAEKRWGDRPPLNCLGLHTLCLVRPAPDQARRN